MFHISNGRPKKCTSTQGRCPFSRHFSTIAEAENQMAEENTPSVLASTVSVRTGGSPVSSSTVSVIPSPASMAKRKPIPAPPRTGGGFRSRTRSEQSNAVPKSAKAHANNAHNAPMRTHGGNAGRSNKNEKRGEAKYFKVVARPSPPQDYFQEFSPTEHFNNERLGRIEKVERELGLKGVCVAQFVVDKKHPNGNEVHQIHENGCVYIFNESSKRLITVLIPRPKQVFRYYDGSNGRPPRWLVEQARENSSRGRNSW